MSGENLDPVTNSDEACVVCCRSRAIMQVSPCGHQCLCRLCFVQNIKEAVASRNLPLRCLICNAKIARVKNNRSGGPGENPDGRPEQSIPVHVRGRTTNIMTRSAPGEMVPKRMPTSVSGYSLCPSTTSSGQEQSHNKRATNGMPLSHSSYSMSSAFSSVSSSSVDSQRSVKSNGSGTSQRSVFSAASNNPSGSWFSIGSLSQFQSAGGFLDSKLMNRVPRAHSLSSRGKSRTKQLTPSPSSNSIRSWTFDGHQSSGGGTLYKDPLLSKSESVHLTAAGGANPGSVTLRPSMSMDSFRKTTNTKGLSLNIDHCLKGQFRRLSGGSGKDLVGRARYIKSPEKIETSFSMSTIEEEEQENVALSLKNLNQDGSVH